MKKITLRQWTAALRSGHYDQTKGTLYDPDERAFCCLGVGCDVSGMEYDYTNDFRESLVEFPDIDLKPDKDDLWFIAPRHGNVYFCDTTEALEAFLTADAIRSLKKRLDTDTPADNLARWNDNGMTFDQIADIIDGVVTAPDWV